MTSHPPFELPLLSSFFVRRPAYALLLLLALLCESIE